MSEKIDMNWEQLTKMSKEVVRDDGPGSATWDPDSSHTKRFNDAFVLEFRANQGKIAGELEGFPFMLLTTKGAKTGAERVAPLAYIEIDDRMLIIASMGGAKRNPPWYHNLVKNPQVGVEVGAESFEAQAVVTEGADREELFRRVVELFPIFGEYQERTERTIPVVELKRI